MSISDSIQASSQVAHQEGVEQDSNPLAPLGENITSLILGRLGAADAQNARQVDRLFYKASLEKTTQFLGCLREEIMRVDPEGYERRWKGAFEALSDETFLKKVSPQFLAGILRRGIFEKMDPEKFHELKEAFAAPKSTRDYTSIYLLFPNELKDAFDLEKDPELTMEKIEKKSMVKGQTEVLRVLHELGVDLLAPDECGFTLLCYATFFGQVSVLRFLGEIGGDPNFVFTPLPPVYRMRPYPEELLSLKGKTPMHMAAMYGQTEALRVLHELGGNLNAQAPLGKTPAHVATSCNQVEVLRVLKELGADLNAQDVFGATPVRELLEKTRSYLTKNRILREEVFRAFKELGADLNAKDLEGETPLHHAARLGQTQAIRILLELGADPKATDLEGNTPLDHARIYGQKEALRVLQEQVETS